MQKRGYMLKREYNGRKYVIAGIIILVAIIFIVRLFFLQVIDNGTKVSAENIALRTETEYPARGRIYDRNHNLLVYNEAVYDLMVIPRQVKHIDTNKFCKLLNIDKEYFIKNLNKAKRYSRYKPSVFVKQLSKEEFGPLQEKLYEFQGFYTQTRTLRHYPMPIAAHLLGSVGEVNAHELKKDKYYRQGDYIGKSGIEKYYEKILRGKKGSRIVEVDVHNRVKGNFQNGRYDTAAIPGNNIILSIDSKLQSYGEALMKNKKGSIVAIQPSTGEILCMISSPGFDPNLLVGRQRSKNYVKLLHDTLKPLINRAVTGQYPPGSTFKLVNALIGLQEKAITPNTYYSCQGTQSKPIACSHNHVSPLALKEAIALSCNSYFWNTFNATLHSPAYHNQHEAYKAWRNYVLKFGFGKPFSTDIPYERGGNIPSGNYYDKLYHGSWNALTVRSLSIGQGEILVTPFQLANLAAVIGNRGYYFPPHFLKHIEGSDTLVKSYLIKHGTSIDSANFNTVIDAMRMVFESEEGTARFYKTGLFSQAGKTGTVQNPHGKDHSIFIAFAPVDNPKIAVAVIVENAGFGSTWAAPIASLIMEKFITGNISRKNLEKRIMEGNLINGKKEKH